ncbi:MAG: GNAT family N-acetyltransferase [Anaerolineae bacterium]
MTNPHPTAAQPDESETLWIVPGEARYAEQQQALMERVYNVKFEEPDSEVFNADMFRHHLSLFPEGQYVALHGDQVVGFTVGMLLDFDPAHPFIEPWFTTISDGWLRRHNTAAEWMYGVESCVDWEYQSRGVGSALMDARFNAARALNLRGMVAGSAWISFRENKERYGDIEPEDYLRRVIAGTLFDTNLTKQIKKGFKPLAVIPDYLRDNDSMGWGSVIIWENPDYDPAKGRGTVERRPVPITLRPKKTRG